MSAAAVTVYIGARHAPWVQRRRRCRRIFRV